MIPIGLYLTGRMGVSSSNTFGFSPYDNSAVLADPDLNDSR
jgi:hypothetical protein